MSKQSARAIATAQRKVQRRAMIIRQLVLMSNGQPAGRKFDPQPKLGRQLLKFVRLQKALRRLQKKVKLDR
jgi:hypothetical protein